LFNVLTAGNPEALVGSVWVDLFAGTGAVGIEALSRGASMVYFVESSRDAADLLRKNLGSLGITRGFQVFQQESAKAIAQLAHQQILPDFIFLDPPYELREAYAETLGSLGDSSISERAVVIAEHEKKFDPAEAFGGLRRTRKLQQGDAALSFYRRA
jgi:16S rRNA (guanine966-N2)-methyltransferase